MITTKKGFLSTYDKIRAIESFFYNSFGVDKVLSGTTATDDDNNTFEFYVIKGGQKQRHFLFTDDDGNILLAFAENL